MPRLPIRRRDSRLHEGRALVAGKRVAIEIGASFTNIDESCRFASSHQGHCHRHDLMIEDRVESRIMNILEPRFVEHGGAGRSEFRRLLYHWPT